MEQLVARQAHNLEVACSSLASATNNDIASCKATGYVVFHFILRQIYDKDFVLLKIVLQKTEIGSVEKYWGCFFCFIVFCIFAL